MKFIVHESPVRRSESNYIARANLGPFGLEGEVEQLWLRQLDDGLLELCCIPFRTYGLALGDVISLSPDGATIAGVARRSGRRVLRILIAPTAGASIVADRVSDEVSRLGLMNEWSGDRHIAVDVPVDVEVGSLIDIAEREELESKAYWEWADAMPFSASSQNS